jgi:hypothetical protein
MSYPSDTPAAAWYPDPQTSGQVRWWDGQNWTEHVSKAAVEAESAAAAQTTAEQTVAEQTTAAQAAAAQASATLTSPALSSAAQAVEHFATVTYIGRHAAGATPALRQPSTAPRIRPRVRVAVPVPVLVPVPVQADLVAQVEALAYA